MNTGNPLNIISHFDFVGLSTDSKPTNVKDGSTFLEVNTTNFYIFYKGTWYNQSSAEEPEEAEE